MTRVRLTTANVLHGVRLSNGSVDPAQLSSAVAALACDVLALQEVDAGQERSARRNQADDLAAASGAVAWRFAATLVGTPGLRRTWRPAAGAPIPDGAPTYGVALLSRLPVDAWATLPLAGAPFRAPLLVPTPDGTRPALVPDEPRVALAAVVRTPAGPISVVATHLSFVPGWNVAQLRRITRWARERLPAPRVLLGDLNLPGPLPTLATGWQRLSRLPTYPASAPRLGLDAALGDAPGLWRVAGSATTPMSISDHAALTVELAVDGA